ADEAERESGQRLLALAEGQRLEPLQGLARILRVEERKRIRVTAVAALPRIARLLFLELGGILEHERGERPRRSGAPDRSAESFGDELRQQPAVIEVGVGEEDAVELARLEGKRLAVARFELFVALVLAAVDEHPTPRE